MKIQPFLVKVSKHVVLSRHKTDINEDLTVQERGY